MNQNQTLNLTSDFFNNYTSIFLKLVFVIILFYSLIIIINFLRDKFINKVDISKPTEINTLLIILNKLCFFSGFGFILANLLSVLFSQGSRNYNSLASINMDNNWNYLTFGVILIFVGIGFKSANKMIQKEK